ncbi:MerC domain-containing protein [Parasphingorhabdus sp.]|uniref:MerC domain-containing protein n=1 Tax=Parasphingorhabdus sp. TaxID=2709688 RepID=UPI00326780DA
MFLSGLCLLHCLGLPLLLILLPALASFIALPEEFHLFAVLLALPVSLLALAIGARQHKSIVPLAVGIFGLLFLAVALTEKFHSDEIILTVIGASGLLFAHINNWRRRSRCLASGGV